MPDKSNDILGVIKDIRQTGTQELENSVSSMLSATPPKPAPEETKSHSITDALSSGEKTPTVSSNQISVAREKREKEIIERRRESA